MRLNKFLNEKTDSVEIDYMDHRKNKRLRKKFKNQKTFEKWLDKNEDDIEVMAYLNEITEASFANGIDKPGSRGPTKGPKSAIDGMSKQKAKTFLYKGTKPYWYNKMYHDEYWQGPKSIWNQFDAWDLNWSIDSSRYRKPGHNSPMDPMIDVSKEWLFTIWMDNNKGKQIKLHGQLIASGAGSVKDPLEKYDIILIIQ